MTTLPPLKTRCFRCGVPLECHWPETMTWAGAPTREEYMSNALRHDRVHVVCDDCLAKMPDVKLEVLRWEEA